MTLEPAARRQLAVDLCARIVDHYPGQVLVGSLYGSTARGQDTPWSDLELFFVVQDDCPAHGRHLLFRDTAVGYRVTRRSALEAILTQPSARWPFHMGVLSVLEVLHGDPGLVSGWLDLGCNVPFSKFQAALVELAPGLVFEAHSRLHSQRARGQSEDLPALVLELLYELRTALCLLNQRWVTHDYYQGLLDTLQFERLPAGYADLFPALHRARDPGLALDLADRLLAAYRALLAEEGIEVPNYDHVAEIPV